MRFSAAHFYCRWHDRRPSTRKAPARSAPHHRTMAGGDGGSWDIVHFLPWHLLSEAIQRVALSRFIIILIGYLLAHAVRVAKWRMVVNAAGAQLITEPVRSVMPAVYSRRCFCLRSSAETWSVWRSACAAVRIPRRCFRKCGRSFSGYERASGPGPAGDSASARFRPDGVAESSAARGVLLCGSRCNRDCAGGPIVPAIAAGTFREIQAMARAIAFCAAKRLPAPPCFVLRMDSGDSDTNHVSHADGAAGHLLRAVPSTARLVFCVAAGKACGASAADPRWDWSKGSGAGGAAVPFWCSSPSRTCRRTCLGRGSHSGRSCGGHYRLSSRPQGSYAGEALIFLRFAKSS